MEHIISIHNSGQEISLEIGKYKIDVLGGWGVELGQFSISFRNNHSGRIINCKRSFWPVQSFAFNKRAKRVFIANIVEQGTYKVEFKNSRTLKVKKTNLFVAGLFQEPIPNEEISVYIY